MRIVLAAVLLGAMTAQAQGLVIARSGDLPILLTVPHGGGESVPGTSPRVRGTVLTDAGTLELAEAVAKDLQAALKGAPYFVAARFSRKYIDANRPPDEAYESPAAKALYDEYHGHIRRFVAELKERFPRGALLLDIHGQSQDPTVVHRGTQNGATVRALAGPAAIFGALEAKGFSVFPPSRAASQREDPRFNGGYTVRTYGSGRPDGIDAIQIEVGRAVRADRGFIAALGEALATFQRTYLSHQ